MVNPQGKPVRVSLGSGSPNPQDEAATRALLEAYTQADGFHCPRCKQVIKNPQTAIEHLVDEINKALGSLPL